jgi:hypothetical protein
VNLAYRRFDIGRSHSSLCFDSRNFLFGEFECRKRRKSELSPAAPTVNVVRRSRLTAATGLSGNESAAIVSAEGIPGFRNAVACWAYEIADPGRSGWRWGSNIPIPGMGFAKTATVTFSAGFVVSTYTLARISWHYFTSGIVRPHLLRAADRALALFAADFFGLDTRPPAAPRHPRQGIRRLWISQISGSLIRWA